MSSISNQGNHVPRIQNDIGAAAAKSAGSDSSSGASDTDEAFDETLKEDQKLSTRDKMLNTRMPEDPGTIDDSKIIHTDFDNSFDDMIDDDLDLHEF